MGRQCDTVRAIWVVVAGIVFGMRADILVAQVPPTSAPDRSVQAMSNAPLSTAQLLAMLKAPRNAAELLENLKVLTDEGLLMEPAFTDDAVLLKAFAGKSVQRGAWTDGPYFIWQDTVVKIEDTRLPNMSVSLRQVRHAPRESIPGDATVQNHPLYRMDLRLTVATLPGLDVCAVRDRFGQRSASIYRPFEVDGVATVSSAEGWVRYPLGAPYTKVPVIAGTPARATGFATFYVGFADPPREALQPGRNIYNSDAVEAIQIVLGEDLAGIP
jgi:hypothetical protein